MTGVCSLSNYPVAMQKTRTVGPNLLGSASAAGILMSVSGTPYPRKFDSFLSVEYSIWSMERHTETLVMID